MTTPEQQARDMLERMGIRNTHQRESAGELVELANLIAERDELKAELQTLRGSAEPVAWLKEWDEQSTCRAPGYMVYIPAGRYADLSQSHDRDVVNQRITPLYTRPAVPLTLKRIGDAARDAQIAYCLDKQPSFEIAFARAIEAAHNIKGAKP